MFQGVWGTLLPCANPELPYIKRKTYKKSLFSQIARHSLREKRKAGRNPAIFTGIPERFRESPNPSSKSGKLQGILKTFQEIRKVERNSQNFQGNQESWKESSKPSRKSQFLPRNVDFYPTWEIKQVTTHQNNPTMGLCRLTWGMK